MEQTAQIIDKPWLGSHLYLKLHALGKSALWWIRFPIRILAVGVELGSKVWRI